MPSLADKLTYTPVELSFGTSGLRGLVKDMTDLECYINTAGFLQFLLHNGELNPGEEIYLAGDLRDSTPRIARAVVTAIADAGNKVVYCDLIPTPALANYAFRLGKPSIMVTGSHIPADRNGIKFYKRHDEVLKDDEAKIKAAVAEVRVRIYTEDVETAAFGTDGSLKSARELPAAIVEAKSAYFDRYLSVFDHRVLSGKHIVMYQHSAVGRDIIVELLTQFGATVTPVGRSEVFIPIDSENVTEENRAYFRELATKYNKPFAIVSTDGDSDRPFVIDETGEFHRGDVLGAIVAMWLKADAAAFPVSSSDAVTTQLTSAKVAWTETKIGSPYVIAAMKKEKDAGKSRVVGWEVNGGFLTGTALELNGNRLQPLPTRDAFIAIFVALLSAIERNEPVSKLFASLPSRFTQAGLLNGFPVEVSAKILKQFDEDRHEVREELASYFNRTLGFGEISDINTTDGVRISFDNGDVAHLRPSGNAPQLRIYSVANSQERADEIVELALSEPNGIFRQIQKALT